VAITSFKPGYDTKECIEILRLAAAVSAFLPRFGGGTDFPVLDPFAPADSSPIVDTVTDPATKVLPSLFYHRWPAGWGAGIREGLKPTWVHSIAVSFASKNPAVPTPSNQAFLAYNRKLDAYCLAFRGTMTAGNAIEDALALMVPAGPCDYQAEVAAAVRIAEHALGRAGDGIEDLLQHIHIPPAVKAYIAAHSTSERSYCAPNIPGVSDRAKVHAGFRLAVESLDFAADFVNLPASGHSVSGLVPHRNTLTGMLQTIAGTARGKPIKIYVTGHSLGAGMASLAAGWLSTQPIAGATFDVKLYAFAQPKPGNDYFSYASTLSFGLDRAFCVMNTLDSVPQLALTLQPLYSVNDPGSLAFLTNLIEKIPVLGPAVVTFFNSLPPLNYVHMGTQVLLEGQPIVPGATSAPGLYNLPPQPDGSWAMPQYLLLPAPAGAGNDAYPQEAAWTNSPGAPNTAEAKTYATLWQHMPWIYQQALVAMR
jgi:hypothetical protein